MSKGTQEKGILNIAHKDETFSLNNVDIGDCVIFNHKYNHQGNPFKDGKKLFLRSELVFDVSDVNLEKNPKLAKIFASSCYMFIESMRKNHLSSNIRQISNDQFNIANRARFNLNNKVNENNNFLIKKVELLNTSETVKTQVVNEVEW